MRTAPITKALTALRAALERGDPLAVPASTYAETLVAPARRGREAMFAVAAFLVDLPAEVKPITRQIAG